MALLRVMLVLTVIAMSVDAYPSAGNVELHKKEITEQNLQQQQPTQQPVALLARNYDSKQKSSIVEFVKENNKENSAVMKGDDSEKYSITNIYYQNNDSNEYETDHDLATGDFSEYQQSNTENVQIFPFSLERKTMTYDDTNPWLQASVESFGERPPYVLGLSTAFEAGLPFEIISRGQSMKQGLYSAPKKDYHRYTVGPALFPQSIYNREFSNPFFPINE